MDKNEIIHAKALAAAQTYRRSEFELLEVLQEVDINKVFYHYGYNSLFKYATDALGLSEEVAYIYINVCRKAQEVPALKEEIKNGSLSVSKAKRITSILNSENQNHWLEIAKTSTKQVLEKKVALASPSLAVRDLLTFVPEEKEVKESVKIVGGVRVQLQVGVSEAFMITLRRAQDLVSQKRGCSANLEDTLSAALDIFIAKNDPLAKAKRQLIMGKLRDKQEGERQKRGSEQQADDAVPPKTGPGHSEVGSNKSAKESLKTKLRDAIPAKTKHKLFLSHDGRCAFVDVNGKRCAQSRFLHVHHLRPVAQGGDNDLANLSLLCAGHHRAEHINI
jgi:hypothetical protein